jgi:hypothetical protein
MKSFREYLAEKKVIEPKIIEESRTEEEKAALIEEAQFAAADLKKALTKVVKVINTATGRTYSLSPLPYYYKNSSGEHEGYYAFDKSGNAIRFLAEPKKSKLNVKKEAGYEVSSFDVFDIDDVKGSGGKPKPTVHVELNGLNIIQSLDEIKKVIKDPKKNNTFSIDVELPNPNKKVKLPVKVLEEGKRVIAVDLIEEAKVQIGEEVYKSMGAAIEALFKMGYEGKEIKKLTGCSAAQLSQALKKVNAMGTIEGKPGSAEAVGAKQIKLPKIPEKVPVDKLFEHLESLVKLILMGLQKGLIVTGQAGVGKCVGADTKVSVKIK